MIDPRSPTNEYNRTPIHCNSNKNANHNNNELNSSLFDDSISSNANDNSLTESSILLQQGK